MLAVGYLLAARLTVSVQEPLTQDEALSEIDQKTPRHAGLGIRVGAALLDIVTMGVPVLLIVFILAQTFGITGDGSIINVEQDDAGIPTGMSSGPGSFQTWAQIIILATVTILLWVNYDGRTPGKIILRIRFVSYPKYQEFGYRTATIRSIVSEVLVFIPYIVKAIMIVVRDDKRGLHDLLAKTVVVHH
jgi:uncharacterized RDD family membrane protein YckC